MSDPDWDNFLEDLRGHVFNYHKTTGKTWKDLSGKSGLTTKTISRFAYRETRRPHLHTVFQLVKACDAKLTLVRQWERRPTRQDVK